MVKAYLCSKNHLVFIEAQLDRRKVAAAAHYLYMGARRKCLLFIGRESTNTSSHICISSL